MSAVTGWSCLLKTDTGVSLLSFLSPALSLWPHYICFYFRTNINDSIICMCRSWHLFCVYALLSRTYCETQQVSTRLFFTPSAYCLMLLYRWQGITQWDSISIGISQITPHPTSPTSHTHTLHRHRLYRKLVVGPSRCHIWENLVQLVSTDDTIPVWHLKAYRRWLYNTKINLYTQHPRCVSLYACRHLQSYNMQSL